jgi:hypothetical protein
MHGPDRAAGWDSSGSAGGTDCAEGTPRAEPVDPLANVTYSRPADAPASAGGRRVWDGREDIAEDDPEDPFSPACSIEYFVWNGERLIPATPEQIIAFREREGYQRLAHWRTLERRRQAPPQPPRGWDLFSRLYHWYRGTLRVLRDVPEAEDAMAEDAEALNADTALGPNASSTAHTAHPTSDLADPLVTPERDE